MPTACRIMGWALSIYLNRRVSPAPHGKIYMLQSTSEENSKELLDRIHIKRPFLGDDIHAWNLMPQKEADQWRSERGALLAQRSAFRGMQGRVKLACIKKMKTRPVWQVHWEWGWQFYRVGEVAGRPWWLRQAPAMQETQVWPLGWEDPLGMATCSSILAWRIPWKEEPGGLWSIGSQRNWTWLSDQAQRGGQGSLSVPWKLW